MLFYYCIMIILKLTNFNLGSKKKTSTSMCTWMAVETIDYFQRHGSEVFVCVMDMTKAFDNVKHSTFVKRLIIKGMPAIFIRLDGNVYTTNCMRSLEWTIIRYFCNQKWSETRGSAISDFILSVHRCCLKYFENGKQDVGLVDSSL